MRFNSVLLLVVLPMFALLAGCVTLQEQDDGSQNLRMPWQGPSEATKQAVKQAELRKQEVIFARDLQAKVEGNVANARVTINTLPGLDKSTMKAIDVVDIIIIDVPAASRGTPAYQNAAKAINDYSRALATFRGATTLEMAMNAESARKTKPFFEAAPTNVVDVEEGGRLSMIRRLDPSVYPNTLRITISPRRI